MALLNRTSGKAGSVGEHERGEFDSCNCSLKSMKYHRIVSMDDERSEPSNRTSSYTSSSHITGGSTVGTRSNLDRQMIKQASLIFDERSMEDFRVRAELSRRVSELGNSELNHSGNLSSNFDQEEVKASKSNASS